MEVPKDAPGLCIEKPIPYRGFLHVLYEGTADHCFTGKEDDVEVGLIYFGKRYYAPLLQRWISADPLAVHAPGEADLNLYAYVHGKVLVAVDPVGLQEAVNGASGGPPAPGVTPPGTTGDVVTLPEVEIIVDVKTPSPAPGGAHATPHETGALTQRGISQGGGKEAYEAWAAGLYGAAWMYCRMDAFERHGPDAFLMTAEALQNADDLQRAGNIVQVDGKDVEHEVVKGQVPVGPKTSIRGSGPWRGGSVQSPSSKGRIQGATWQDAVPSENPGRAGKQERLRQLADSEQSPDVPRSIRGWLLNEIRHILFGDRRSIRLPGNSRKSAAEGKVLAHPRGKRAKDGHPYTDGAYIQDADLHKLEHKWEGY